MSRVTSVKTFRQYDSRWGSHKYPNTRYTMHSSGCGPTACADVIASSPKHKDVTPETLRKYMISNGFCVAGAGTAWSGIGAALQKYGFSVKNHSTMPAFFAEMKKDGRCGILLLTKGTRGGVTWTTGGHFLACSGHKVSNGKNYLYMHDPGGRKHDGWYCYETTMQGLVRQVWSCCIKTDTDKKTTTAAKKTAAYKGFDISNWQGKISVDRFKKAKAAGYSFVIIRCGFAGNDPLNKDAAFEINYKNAIKAGMKVGMYYYSKARTVAAARREANYCLQLINGRALHYPIYIDFEDKVQSNLGKTLSASICNAFCEVIEREGYAAGVYANWNYLTNKIGTISAKYDIWLAQYPTATYKGKYTMHQHSDKGTVPGIGSPIDVNTATLKPASRPKNLLKYPAENLRKGDAGYQVIKLQRCLNQLINAKLNVDGIFGPATEKAVKRLQNKYRFEVDGIVGPMTRAKIKELVK